MTSSTNHITLSGVIGEAGGSRALTKAGPGALYLRSLGNLFTGATTVEEGVLALDGATPAILGNITVGNGNAADGTARLFVKRPEQIADFANVQVNADSDLLVEAEERIAGLTVNGGSVLVTGNGPFGPGVLTLGSLTMAGGVVDTSGIGKLRLEGDLTATSNAQSPAIVRRADNNSTGTLDLVGAAHVFAVSQGPSAVRDLDFSLPLVETGSAGITKDGAGRMRFFGEVSNKYTGVTVVRQGRLELAKSPSTVSVPGSLQIGAGAGPVVVELSEAHNINQNATVSVSDASTFILNGDQVLGGLGVGSGSLVQIGATKEIGARASNLTIAGGRIVVVKASSTFHAETSIVATSTAGRPATIEGPGRFAMVGAIPMFVLDGPEAIDLLIAAQWSASADDGRITKRDPGVAQFGDGGDFSSGLTLSAGTVFINGSHRINPVSLEGGVLGGTGPCLLYTSPSPRDRTRSRMPSSA